MFTILDKKSRGLEHAVWCAREFIGNEPFAILFGDDIVESSTPALKQFIQQYVPTERSIVGVQQVSEDETHRYGIIDPSSSKDRRYKVNHFIEKPKPGTALSNLAIMDR